MGTWDGVPGATDVLCGKSVHRRPLEDHMQRVRTTDSRETLLSLGPTDPPKATGGGLVRDSGLLPPGHGSEEKNPKPEEHSLQT